MMQRVLKLNQNAVHSALFCRSTLFFGSTLLLTLSYVTRAASAETTDAADVSSDAAIPVASSDQAWLPAKQLMSFLRQNCLDCHDGSDGEGGFDLNAVPLTAIPTASAKGHSIEKSFHLWQRVFDRINDGEMPPKDYGELDSDERESFLNTTRRWINETLTQHHKQNGRVRSRRLTNDQLQWTLCDLLSIDLPLANLMPEEQRTDGFRNIADAQSMSHYHLEDHLVVVDAALDYALNRLRRADRSTVIDLPAERIANKPAGRRNRDPELRKGAAVIWTSTMSFYGRISRTTVPESGWYRITLDASGIKPPKDRNIWCSIRSGKCVSSAPLMNWVGSLEVTEEPQTYVFDAWIEADHMLEIRPADSTLKRARFRGGQVGFGEGEPQDVPGLAMHHLELKRIYPGGNVDDVRKSLFGDLDVHFDAESNQFRWNGTESIEPELINQLRRFAARAFRRPVSDEMLEPFESIIRRGLEQDPVSQLDVLRQAYRAVLCSPRFVYFYETPGRLDDHAIANRLSLMLTGRSPDRRLRKAADNGKLSKPDVLIRQTRRLLDSEALDHFVNDFTDQWLDLADIDFTQPDRRMHGDFDLIVQNAMVQETRRFIKALIQNNAPARSLVDADHSWMNSRLAAYYQIDAEIEPSSWKKVSLADHPYRGGLMTHGSILKVTANGTNTSPVVRGVWICDRLLGVPIPDPPENVPAIEPDVRGATTVRQILEKHRSQTECAACHARIDPPGFALEHFDAAGRWRDRYLKRGKKGYDKGPEVDSAYQLSDGREFDSFAEFRELAASDDDRVARNFAAMLLTYATGREMTFADRKVLDKIADETRTDQHRLRDIIESVVTSETFLCK